MVANHYCLADQDFDWNVWTTQEEAEPVELAPVMVAERYCLVDQELDWNV
jgi:hypothetical protein